jgi:hypothetical protein
MVVPVEEISANGEQCLNYLSQPRGQPQAFPFNQWTFPKILSIEPQKIETVNTG